MSIETRCPYTNCDARFVVTEEQIGKTARCKKCGKRFKVARGIGVPLFDTPIEPTSKPKPQQTVPDLTRPQQAVTQPAQPAADDTPQLDPAVTQPAGGGPQASVTQPAGNHLPQDPQVDVTQRDGRALDEAGGPQKPEDLHAAEDQVPAEWDVGEVILDIYEVRKLSDSLDYAQGGFGRVYRVHHRGWNMDLAVKSPLADKFRSEQEKQSFIAECETWIELGLHPNIVSCYYVRVLGHIPRVFAEFVEGGSLEDWIRDEPDGRPGRLYEGGTDKASERILDIAVQFAWGLHYAHEHEQKLVHQDVKPQNVMMTPDGEAKVSDFGLAKARAAAGDPGGDGGQGQSIKVKGAGFMTEAYRSPEQANGEPLTRKTDIWSWAVSVVDMFCGEVHRGAGEAAMELLEEHLASSEPPKEHLPKMPQAVADLLRQCLQEDPDRRPKDMAEIAGGLKEIYQDVTGQAYPREEPKAAELLADSLNNRAVSMLDLKKQDEAEKLFTEAIEIDPHHPEATYNRGLILWRAGRIADDELVRQLEEVRQSHPDAWRDEYLLGLVHLERGDGPSAVKVLEQAAQQAGDDTEVKSALTAARDRAVQDTSRTFEVHTGPVDSISISADGRWGLSGSHDKTLRLWDLTTGQCVRTLEGHTGWVCSVSISADGHWGLSGSVDETLRLWDLTTGKCVRTFEGHSYNVTTVSISADGRWGLTGSGNEVRLWDLATGKCVRTFEGHTKTVNSVSISADDRWGLSGSWDKTVRLWDLTTGKCQRTFEGHADVVKSVSISADGRWGLSGSRDKTVRLWDLTTGKCVRIIEGCADDVTTVSISADGHMGLSGSMYDKTFRLWDLTTCECVRTFVGHTDMKLSVSISADGRWGLSGSYDKTVRLWDLGTGPTAPFAVTLPRSTEEITEHAGTVQRAIQTAQAALENGRPGEALKELAWARQIHGYERHGELLTLWHKVGLHCTAISLRSAWCARQFQGHTNRVFSVSISADGRWGLLGSGNEVRLWDLATGKCVRTFEGHTESVWSVSISANGRWGLSGSYDNTVRLWDLTTGKCVRTFKGHTSGVGSVSLNADGRWGLSGSWDETVRLWDLATGKCLRTFKGHTDSVRSVSISADGRWGLSGSFDNTLRLWELATGKCLRTFEGHTSSVLSVSISADGRWGLTGSGNEVRLWDLAIGECVRTFEGHTKTVNSVSISADDRWGLSGSSDKTVRLWDLATGKCVRTFVGHTYWVDSVSISADGRWGLSGGEDNTLRLWELDWEYEFPGWADWDEGALPCLESFLTLHCPYGDDGPGLGGRPVWNDEDFQQLIKDLQHRGYGWLRPEGVRKKLEEMTANWQGPPPMPWGNATPAQDHLRPPKPIDIHSTKPASAKAGKGMAETIPTQTSPPARKRRMFRVEESDKSSKQKPMPGACPQERTTQQSWARKPGLAETPPLEAPRVMPGIGPVRQEVLSILIIEAVRRDKGRAIEKSSDFEAALAAGVRNVFEDKLAEATACPSCGATALADFCMQTGAKPFHMCLRCGFDDRKNGTGQLSEGAPAEPGSGPAKKKDLLRKEGKQSSPGGTATQRVVTGLDGRKACPCGKENPPASTFCVACGKRLPDPGPRTCPHCREMISDGIRFCLHCGKKAGG